MFMRPGGCVSFWLLIVLISFSRPPTQLRIARWHARTKRNDFLVGRLRSTSISPPYLRPPPGIFWICFSTSYPHEFPWRGEL